MIDFHSHILPGVDDGSKDENESLEMLRMLWNQGVRTVIATPHFDPDKESTDDFIGRRQDAYNKLLSLMDSECPRILLGAEVIYYDGISNLEGLEKLCIGDSNLLLLEMPMCRWSQYAFSELKNLTCTKGYRIILAHIERYIKDQPQSVWMGLRQLGVLNQVNASFFLRPLQRRKAVSMLLEGDINVIGSDCHNLDTRPPNIGSAFEFIKSKAGEGFLQDFTEYTNQILFDD